ncbi:MAG: class I SAM-dependent methyltransferase [Streptosporangiaceae bacterium]
MTAAGPPGPGQGWRWDETLYAGAAPYYSRGRMPYPAGLIAALRDGLALDGTGAVLDAGCGPGALTLLLAPLAGEVTGLDGSAGMIAAARSAAGRAGITNARWVQLRAEDMTAALGRFRAVTFAQSFHWLDRPAVAARVREVLEPGGACALVYATTHAGVPGEYALPRPRPPRAEIDRLVAAYLGSIKRAGRGTRTGGTGGEQAMHASDEEVLTDAGFTGPERTEIPGAPVTERTEDEVVASVFSLSYAAPHLLGDDVDRFETDLRALLRRAAPDGQFCEEPRGIAVDVWRPGS